MNLYKLLISLFTMKKKYIQLHIWIDRNNNWFGGIILVLTILSVLLLQLSNNIVSLSLGISSLLLVAIMALLRKKWNESEIDLEDFYDLPVEGDIIIVTNDDKLRFYLELQSNYIGLVNNGDEFQVTKVKIKNKEVRIHFKYQYKNKYYVSSIGTTGEQIAFLDYFPTKKYWSTKANIRNDKLEKLGI